MSPRWSFPLAVLLAGTAVAAEPLAIRTYPEREIRVHEIDRQHGLHSALLQNLALVNESGQALTVERVQLSLQIDRGTQQTQVLEAAELARLAARSRTLADGGLLDLFDFQFRPSQLLGDGVQPSASASLAPRQALLLLYRPFLFNGTATALQVDVDARDATGQPLQAHRAIPLSARVARGYRFPLSGSWYVAASASFHTAHRWAVAEEFAYDLLRLGADGRTHRGKGQRLADFHAYGRPVLAARGGKVVRAVDDVAEDAGLLRRAGESKPDYLQRVMQNQAALLATGKSKAAGSHVVVDHGNGEFSSYAHLVPGSLRVEAGDTVRAGQVLGRLGHSGNSTEPHLHFQVCDGPDPLYCAGLPVQFDDLDVVTGDVERALQAGDMVIAR
ncbi:M23 family metallopeptidase [Tahibacter caeni]|uniref:M23 family metallopeptidase n=1 Tax=Tahibacter caeni TaxID=1453545 RepID=UPI0021491944|nr:M23 family metallopeptidase [Tahibacter caeni]